MELKQHLFSCALLFLSSLYAYPVFADKLKASEKMLFQNYMNFCICKSWMIVFTAVYVFLDTWKEKILYRCNVEIVVNESSYLDFFYLYLEYSKVFLELVFTGMEVFPHYGSSSRQGTFLSLTQGWQKRQSSWHLILSVLCSLNNLDIFDSSVIVFW